MLSGIEPSASMLRRVAEAAENAASSEKEVAVGRVKPLSTFRAGWIRTLRQQRPPAVLVSRSPAYRRRLEASPRVRNLPL